MKTINFKNLEWIVLEENNDTTKLLLKNILDAEHIKKYCDDDWYIYNCYTALTDNIRPPFEWDKSYVKNVMLENFKKDLNVECSIDLLSKEEVEQLDGEIKKCNDYYWTKSNYNRKRIAYAWYVDRDGLLGGTVSYASDHGLRPVITLKSNFSKSKIEKIEMDNQGRIGVSRENCSNLGVQKVIVSKLNEIIDKLNEVSNA